MEIIKMMFDPALPHSRCLGLIGTRPLRPEPECTIGRGQSPGRSSGQVHDVPHQGHAGEGADDRGVRRRQCACARTRGCAPKFRMPGSATKSVSRNHAQGGFGGGDVPWRSGEAALGCLQPAHRFPAAAADLRRGAAGPRPRRKRDHPRRHLLQGLPGSSTLNSIWDGRWTTCPPTRRWSRRPSYASTADAFLPRGTATSIQAVSIGSASTRSSLTRTSPSSRASPSSTGSGRCGGLSTFVAPVIWQTARGAWGTVLLGPEGFLV